MPAPDFGDRVFLNVPFDRRYKSLFEALVFAVHDCGLIARCALEGDDGSVVRLDKIFEIVSECRSGIHDLSRTTLDTANRLPPFNMPLELGVFLGAKRFGDARQGSKSCLILDRDPYRYQVFCSDIAGQDIRAHGNVSLSRTPEGRRTRPWLPTPEVPRREGSTDRGRAFLFLRREQSGWAVLTGAVRPNSTATSTFRPA